MRQFRKYEFGSKGAATTKIKALGVDEDGIPTHKHIIVHLGEIQGSDKYHIDVLWDGQAESNWDNQMIWCAPIGVHTFGSKAAQEYTQACYEVNPEMIPVIQEKETEE
jgi:hypothetical protein